MNWTSVQVAEKIGCSNMLIKKLVAVGLLAPVNAPKPGAQKFFAKFDSAQVTTLIRSGALRKSGGRTYINEAFPPVHEPLPEPKNTRVSVRPLTAEERAAEAEKPAPGILTRLATIEARLEAMQGDHGDLLIRIEQKLDTLLAVWV